MQASCTLSPILDSIRIGIEGLSAETPALFDEPCRLAVAQTPSQAPSFPVHSALEKKEADFSLYAASHKQVLRLLWAAQSD
jgi:hypothetical protein